MDKLSPQIEPCLNQFQLPPLQKLLLMLPARSRTDRLEFHLLFPQLDCGENLQGKSRARGLKGLPACWKEACYKCQWSVPSLSQKNSLGFKFCLFWFHTVSEDEENASGLGPIVRLPPPPQCLRLPLTTFCLLKTDTKIHISKQSLSLGMDVRNKCTHPRLGTLVSSLRYLLPEATLDASSLLLTSSLPLPCSGPIGEGRGGRRVTVKATPKTKPLRTGWGNKKFKLIWFQGCLDGAVG